jgi:WD40 repeat protein
VQASAFAAGREAEEIRALWKAAHQKVLLDEAWLAALLREPFPPPASVPVEQSRGADSGSSPTPAAPSDGALASPPGHSPPSRGPLASRDSAVSGPRVEWGDALYVPSFYGREGELATLEQWVAQERCRVVSVLGMGGIGKSALVTSAMRQVGEHFQVVLFHSLRDAPSCEALLEDCLQRLAPQPLEVGAADLQRRLSLLLEELQEQRVLLVLDNLEALLLEGEVLGHLRPGYEGYSRLLQGVAERAHQSCLLLTSREKPAALRALEVLQTLVRSLRLGGLEAAACEQLLASHALLGSPEERGRLMERYEGNPLALNIVAETIVDLFGGQIAPFLAQDTLVFGSISGLLDEQWRRLSALEQTLLFWLAILREPVTLEELQAVLATPLRGAQVLEALEALRHRSLIERGKRRGNFTLQSVVLEYATTRLITEATGEIEQGRLARLRDVYPQRAEVEGRLRTLLDQVRAWNEDAQGYGPANLVTLLRVLRGNLRGLDLSRMALHGVYLQGVEMQDADLSGALLRDTVFTEAFDAVWAVAINRTGQYWAAGSMQGKVRVWEKGGQTLRMVWQAHADVVLALKLSPDGSALTSSSMDGTVKQWDLESGTLLWAKRQSSAQSLALSPDGSLLASGGQEATVLLWDAQSGTHLQTLPHPSHIVGIAWSPDGQMLASGCSDGQILLWNVQKTAPATYVGTLSGHTSWVTGLTFAPDGRTLASACWDRTVKLWEVTSRRLLQTLTGHTDRAFYIDWSPDGDTNGQLTIWNVDDEAPPRVLDGHSWTIAGVAWSPDGRWLASSGWDDTIRLWDATSWTCLETLQDPTTVLRGIAWSPDGHRLACGTYSRGVHVWDMITRSRLQWTGQTEFRRLAWSLDGTQIVSAGTNGIIYLWNSEDGTLLRQLPGHQGMVASVAWSPDGTRLLSGGGRDSGELFIWDVQRGEQVQTFAGSAGIIYAGVWAPIGDRVVSGDSDGVLRWWDVHSGQCTNQQEAHEGTIMSLKISPDGRRLASCGNDGAIRLWDLESGKPPGTLRRDRPYERMNIAGIRGLTEAQKTMLLTLGARIESPENS